MNSESKVIEVARYKSFDPLSGKRQKARFSANNDRYI